MDCDVTVENSLRIVMSFPMDCDVTRTFIVDYDVTLCGL